MNQSVALVNDKFVGFISSHCRPANYYRTLFIRPGGSSGLFGFFVSLEESAASGTNALVHCSGWQIMHLPIQEMALTVLE